MVSLADINRDITDRSNCFYWQTDRKIDPSEAGAIFMKRHERIDDDEIRVTAAGALKVDPRDVVVVSRNGVTQNDRGNVNAVRSIEVNGKRYIMRMHPKGLKNGYFYSESVAADAALKAGVPSYHTVWSVHPRQLPPSPRPWLPRGT